MQSIPASMAHLIDCVPWACAAIFRPAYGQCLRQSLALPGCTGVRRWSFELPAEIGLTQPALKLTGFDPPLYIRVSSIDELA